MDDKGHLIITDAQGKETFRGRSFEENGLEERSMNRRDRRAQAAIDRLEAKLRADMKRSAYSPTPATQED